MQRTDPNKRCKVSVSALGSSAMHSLKYGLLPIESRRFKNIFVEYSLAAQPDVPSVAINFRSLLMTALTAHTRRKQVCRQFAKVHN